MKKYHISPETGNPGLCRAKTACPFGGPESHYESSADARRAYELSMGPEAKKQARAKAEATVDQGVDAQAQKAYDDFITPAHAPAASLASIQTTPLSEDLAHGVAVASNELASRNKSKYGWDAIMGSTVRRTGGNVEIYQRHLRNAIIADDDWKERARQHALTVAKRDSYGRAYEQGVPLAPELDQAFEAIWNGQATGKSHDDLVADGQRFQATRADLTQGRITPTSVVGSGLRNPSKAAKEYLDSQLLATARALKTRGRSDSLNVANATYRTDGDSHG